MRNPKRKAHIDTSRQGSIIIRYVTVTGDRVVRRIIVHGILGHRLDIKSYMSNHKIHELTSYNSTYVPVTYNFDHLTKHDVKFTAVPSHLAIYVKPKSLKNQLSASNKMLNPLTQHNPHKKRKSLILLRYICNHNKLLYTAKAINVVGRLFSVTPYISNFYIHYHINKKVIYDHVSLKCPRRFRRYTQVATIYLSTIHTPEHLGKIFIKYHYPEIHHEKIVTSYAKIGTRFHILPYCNLLEVNHNVNVNGIYGLFKSIRSSKGVTSYKEKPQTVNIYAKEHSIEISISVPQTIIESLERYIRHGSEPYFSYSEGPIDINRSSLIRYLMSAYGDKVTRMSYALVGEICRADPSHRYITLKTANTHIIRRKGDRLSRLVCAMVRERVPIMSFKHSSNGQLIRDKHGKPVIKRLYYPSSD